MALAISDEVVDQQHRDKHDCHLEQVEAEIHLVQPKTPADDDEEREEE